VNSVIRFKLSWDLNLQAFERLSDALYNHSVPFARGIGAEEWPGSCTALHAKEIDMRKWFALIVIVGALVAWRAPVSAQDYAPDNSGKNVRDRDPDAVTAGDQAPNKSDVTITQLIRKAVMADDALSTDAHNVKIITTNGVVTLRGPVKNAEEKATIAEKAQHVAGVTRIDNQLEIASQ